jgi:hypothetical protein
MFSRKLFGIVVAFGAMAQVSGCAAVSSKTAANNDGLRYYLPLRKIVVEVTLPEEKKDAAKEPPKQSDSGKPAAVVSKAGSTNAPDAAASDEKPAPNNATAKAEAPKENAKAPEDAPKAGVIVVRAGAAYPDLTHAYVLSFGSSLIAKTSATVTVTQSGLLSTATAKVESQLVEALKNLAASVGAKAADETAVDESKSPCVRGRTYTLQLDPAKDVDNSHSLCGFSISITRLFQLEQRPNNALLVVRDAPTGQIGRAKRSNVRQGLYYRQALPYLVAVTDETKNATQSIVLSPSESSIGFLPARRSAFAAVNSLEVDFVDGVPTKVAHAADGEFTALLKLPADIIGAYFDAIGNVFTKRKANASAEKDLIEAWDKLATQKLKEQKCREALATEDLEKVKAACGE